MSTKSTKEFQQYNTSFKSLLWCDPFGFLRNGTICSSNIIMGPDGDGPWLTSQAPRPHWPPGPGSVQSITIVWNFGCLSFHAFGAWRGGGRFLPFHLLNCKTLKLKTVSIPFQYHNVSDSSLGFIKHCYSANYENTNSDKGYQIPVELIDYQGPGFYEPPTRPQSRSHPGSTRWRLLPASTSLSCKAAGTEPPLGWQNGTPSTAAQVRLVTSEFHSNACEFRHVSQHLCLEAGPPYLIRSFSCPGLA